MTATGTTEDTRWTIAYRNPRANHFKRATDFCGTWQEARDIGRLAAISRPDLEVWVTTTQAAEATGYVHSEDIANILANSGRRVQVLNTGTIAVFGFLS